MNSKWIKKYLTIARTLAEDNDACFSRQIGCVLVSPNNSIINVSYNGSCRGVPHHDSKEWWSFLMSDLLTNEEREIIKEKLTRYKSFPGECPRKILGIKSGERMELCAGCAHAEANIVSNCAREGIRTLGASLYCWCGVPCFSPCSQAIIQSGIKKVICLKQDDDYSKSSRWLLNKAGVELIEVEEKVLWE